MLFTLIFKSNNKNMILLISFISFYSFVLKNTFSKDIPLKKETSNLKQERILIKEKPLLFDSPSTLHLTLDEEDLKDFHFTNVGKAIQELTGIFAHSQSGPRQKTQLSLRGGEFNHLEIFIDGVKVNDAASPGGSFDFGNLSTKNIKRIEIFKGSQSTLIQSHAISGAINIVTKKSTVKPIAIKISRGSFSTLNTTFSYSKIFNDRLSHLFHAHYTQSKGFSAAKKNHPKNNSTEKDGYRDLLFSSNTHLNILDNLKAHLLFRFSDLKIELDSYDYLDQVAIDDLNHKNKNQSFLSKLSLQHHFNSLLNQEFTLSWNQLLRKYDNPPDTDQKKDHYKNEFLGERFTFQWIQSFYIPKSFKLSSFIEFEKEQFHSSFSTQIPNSKFENKASINKGTFALQGFYKKNIFFSNLNLKFHSFLSHKLGIGLDLKPIGIFQMSYGTGFKKPSLYQLHSSSSLPTQSSSEEPIFKKETLKSEKSKTWDIHFTKNIKDLRFELTYFHWTYKNKIKYLSQNQSYTNAGNQIGQGVEIHLKKNIKRKISTSFAFHFLKAKDSKTQEPIDLRPQFSWVANLAYHFSKALQLKLNTLYVGKRTLSKTEFRSYVIRLPSYVIFNAYGNYQIQKNFLLFLKIENLLNQSYEEVPSYNTQGRTFYIGASLNL